ncbi:hypothetical protein, partial [Candidatus Darwinibacter acetoxidans]
NPGRKEGGEEMKVIRMVTTYGHNPVSEEHKMKALYAAADSVFALPPYEQVLFFRDGGPEPEMPPCVVGTPGGFYAVGRMKDATEMSSVRIVTDGGREIVVEQNRVTVNFRTGLRGPSIEAARLVLEHLHQHTIDEICFIDLEDGRHISDADIAPEEVA